MNYLNAVDAEIVAAYFLCALAIGLIFARRAGRNIEEYFVSGRNLPWWLVGTSMVATTFATDTPMLITNLVRTRGIGGNWAWWAFLLTGMVTVFFYARLWRRSGVLTDIGFYELRYSGRAAAFLRGFRAIYLGLVFNVIVMGVVTLAAIKISGILLGLDKYTTVLICGAITAIYSSTAGLWGVVVTDLFLFVMAMTGSIGAAYYALSHESVGGLSGLLGHPQAASYLNILPDFSRWEEAVPVFIIPFAVQWWSVWYPGSEPGGGGFVAQRMLASKDEKNSLAATLWFNVAHYAIRPWPWIIVALCSTIVYPTLSHIQDQFPQLDAGLIDHDLAYPAMLIVLPHGMLGLVVASLAAAYMSTISTCLNWGGVLSRRRFLQAFRAVRWRYPSLRQAGAHVDGNTHDPDGAVFIYPGKRAGRFRDPAADRSGNGIDIHAAVVLVANQRLERNLCHGGFVRSSTIFQIPARSGPGMSGAGTMAGVDYRRGGHHGQLADGYVYHAGNGPGCTAGVLRQDSPDGSRLAERGRYRWC